MAERMGPVRMAAPKMSGGVATASRSFGGPRSGGFEARASSGPRITSGERFGPQSFGSRDLGKFAGRFSGSRLEVLRSPSSPKTSHIPEYNPATPRNLNAYTTFGNKERTKSLESTPQKAAQSAPFERRLKTVDINSLAVLARRTSTQELKRAVQSPVSSEKKAQLQDTSARISRAFPTTRAFPAVESSPKVDSSSGRAGSMSAESMQTLLRQPAFTGRAERVPNAAQSQMDTVRILSIKDVRPINPDRQVISPQRFTQPIIGERSSGAGIEARKREIRQQLEQQIKHQEQPAGLIDTHTPETSASPNAKTNSENIHTKNEQPSVVPELPKILLQETGGKYKVESIIRERRRFGLPINPQIINRALAQDSARDERETEIINKVVQERIARDSKDSLRRFEGVNGARPETPAKVKQAQNNTKYNLTDLVYWKELLESKKKKKKVSNAIATDIQSEVQAQAEVKVAPIIKTEASTRLLRKLTHVIKPGKLPEIQSDIKVHTAVNMEAVAATNVSALPDLKVATERMVSLPKETDRKVIEMREGTFYTPKNQRVDGLPFTIDQSAQQARESIAERAIKDAEIKGTKEVDGFVVAAHIANQKSESVISGLLKSLGILGGQGKSMVDGSYEALINFVAGMGTHTKKDAKSFIHEGIERFPAVLMGKGKIEATEQQVRLVLDPKMITDAQIA